MVHHLAARTFALLPRTTTAALTWLPSCSRPLNYRNYATSSFYNNRELEHYASREAKRLSLRQLIFFGRSMTPEKILKSANYVRTELPVRIAHRLRDLQGLPYVVVTQEGMDKVYELYWLAFEQFRQYPEVRSLEENEKFCEFLDKLLNAHATVIPNLSLGLSLSSRFLSPDKLDSFMRRMLVSRISRRVLAEHHIALTKSFSKTEEETSEPHVGIIFTGLNVKHSVDRCTQLLRSRPPQVEDITISSWPEVIVDGHLDAKFPYIREQLEYIVFELLKNAMHATVLTHHKNGVLPPIRVTVFAGEHDIGLRISDQGGGLVTSGNIVANPADLCSFSHIRNASRLENDRIGALRSATASEKGIRATVQEQVLWWKDDLEGNDSFNQQLPPSQTPQGNTRIGIGLPMSKIFATYFGGSLDLVSMDGWGTDVYVRLPKLGTNLEDIEL